MPDGTPPSHDQLEQLAALAALCGPDALTPAERAALATALEHDPDLARASQDFALLVRTMPAVDPTMEVAMDAPPDDLRGAVLDAVRRENDQARDAGRGLLRWLPMVAAAAIAVVVGVGIGRATAPVPPAAPIEQLALDVADFAVTEADLIAHTWGTELLFTFDGTTSGESYDVVVTAADGTVFAAGSFLGDAERTVDCEMNVALLAQDAASFEVTDASGRVVVAGALPGAPQG